MMNFLFRLGDLIPKFVIALVVALLLMIGLVAWKIWGGAH